MFAASPTSADKPCDDVTTSCFTHTCGSLWVKIKASDVRYRPQSCTHSSPNLSLPDCGRGEETAQTISEHIFYVSVRSEDEDFEVEVNEPSSCFRARHVAFTAQPSEDNQSEHAAAPE